MGEEERGAQQRLREALLAALVGAAYEQASLVPTMPPTVARYYEGTFLDFPGTGAALKVVSIPLPPDVHAHSFGSPGERPSWLLDARVSMGVEADYLVPALLATRPDKSPWWAGARLGDEDLPPARGPLGFDVVHLQDFAVALHSQAPEVTRFASKVVLEPVLPVESSPLEGRSLGELVAAAGTSAWLGSVAFVGDPVIWVETGGAIIVLGAAAGISDGLRRGLSYRIARWFGAEEGQVPEADEGDEAH